MIPVKAEWVSKIEINKIEDRVYRDLLRKDYLVISNHRDYIQQKANVLYTNVIKRNNPYFSKISCDFQKLEMALEAFLINTK